MDVPALMEIPIGGGDPGCSTVWSTRPARSSGWGSSSDPSSRPTAHDRDDQRPARSQRSDVTLKLLDLKSKKVAIPAWTRSHRSATRTRHGGPTASGSPTCTTIVTARRARPGSTCTTPDTKKANAITGPGYIHPAWSPDGKYLAATRTSEFGTDVVILDAATGAELLESRRRRQLGAHVVAGRRPGRVPACRGPGRGPANGPARGHGPRLDRRRDDRPDHAAGLDSVSIPDWRSRQTSSRRRPRPPPPSRRPHRRPRPVTPRLPRAAGRADDGHRLGPVPRHRPRSGRPPGGLRADLGGSSAFARLLVEAALPYAAAVKPNLAFFEAYGSAGLAALERLRAMVPADVPFVADAKRGDIGTTAARQAVALFDALGADAVTVNPYLGAEAIAAPPRARRPLRLRPVPHVEPGRRRAPGPRGRGGRRRPAIPPSRSTRGSQARRLGSGRHRRPRRRCHGARGAGGDPRHRARPRVPGPGRRSPGWRDRPGPRRRSRDGRSRRGRQPAGACSSTCRAASRGRPWWTTAAAPTEPGERLADAAAEWAAASLCYPEPSRPTECPSCNEVERRPCRSTSDPSSSSSS